MKSFTTPGSLNPNIQLFPIYKQLKYDIIIILPKVTPYPRMSL